jgi:hypothetical protein
VNRHGYLVSDTDAGASDAGGSVSVSSFQRVVSVDGRSASILVHEVGDADGRTRKYVRVIRPDGSVLSSGTPPPGLMKRVV